MIKDLKNFTSTMSVLKDLMDMSSDQSKINETLGHLEEQMKNYRPKMNLSFVNKSDNPDPTYHYGSDSGFDLLSNQETTIPAGTRTIVSTGLFFDIPYGYEIQVRSKSGLALNKGLFVLNSPGTVDSGYNGEIWINRYIIKKMQRKKEEVKPREVYVNKKDLINSIVTKRQRKKFLTDSQKEYYDILCKNQITICSGPAGVGKSFVAMRAAIDLLCDPENGYEKIIIVRPAVEAEEKLGSLPGNVEEKLDPYIFPSYYLMNKIIGKEAREKLKEVEIIEVFALAYMRGMNIDNSILIFEEGQNATPKQMKLLLTRIGFNSKFFISGDLEQTDRYKDKTHSGLYDALMKFKDVEDIGVFSFDNKDIIRNPLINKILDKYEQ